MIDLQQFCDNELHRFQATCVPHTYGGRTYATDGRILLCVPAVGPDDLKKDDKSFMTPDGKRFPPAWTMPLPTEADVANASLWSPWPAVDYEMGPSCAACNGRRRVRGKTCDECGGNGDTECEACGHERRCEFCDGRGFLLGTACEYCKDLGDGPFPQHQRFGNRRVAIGYDAKVRTLPNLRYKPGGKAQEMIAFAFDGGVGLLVPLVRAEDFK